jgi:hypothetical protein
LIVLLGMVSLIIALAQVYSADDIVRRLVKGLEPADLARLAREQPTRRISSSFQYLAAGYQ